MHRIKGVEVPDGTDEQRQQKGQRQPPGPHPAFTVEKTASAPAQITISLHQKVQRPRDAPQHARDRPAASASANAKYARRSPAPITSTPSNLAQKAPVLRMLGRRRGLARFAARGAAALPRVSWLTRFNPPSTLLKPIISLYSIHQTAGKFNGAVFAAAPRARPSARQIAVVKHRQAVQRAGQGTRRGGARRRGSAGYSASPASARITASNSRP
jgi:hypothetical protein